MIGSPRRAGSFPMKRLKASRRELSCRPEVSSSHEITWSDSAIRSASFNSEVATVGISSAVERDQTGSFCLFGFALPQLICGQFVEHCKPSTLQKIQPSSWLHCSRDSRVHSPIALVRDLRLSSAAMGLEEIQWLSCTRRT